MNLPIESWTPTRRVGSYLTVLTAGFVFLSFNNRHRIRWKPKRALYENTIGQIVRVRVQALCGELDRREIALPEFVANCNRLIADAIGCNRAGIWLLEGPGDQAILRCLGLFDRTTGRNALAPDESQDRSAPYFNALRTAGHVVAPDAISHPATRGFFGDKLGARGVRSLLACAFSINGQVFGAFTCTQVECTMAWTPANLAALKRIGARVSLALAGASAAEQTSLPMYL